MKRKKTERGDSRGKSPAWVRASISFPRDLYRTLEDLARQKKVSLAWVVRDASEKYVAGQDLTTARHG